jgi:hypothetical protein
VKIAHKSGFSAVIPEQERQRTNGLAATHSPFGISMRNRMPSGQAAACLFCGSDKFYSFIGMPERL